MFKLEVKWDLKKCPSVHPSLPGLPDNIVNVHNDNKVLLNGNSVKLAFFWS